MLESLSRRLIYGPGGEQLEQKSEKIVTVVVVRGNDCSHYVRNCLKWEVDQARRAGEVVLKRRRLRIALRTVEEVYFLKNWCLFHEAKERDEKSSMIKRRKYQ